MLLRRRRRSGYRLTFAALAVAGLAYTVLQSLVAPALPALQHDLHTSESGASWVLTAFLLSGSVCTPIVGRLGDIHGKERVLVLVLAVMAVGTAMSALATSLPLMLAGRVVQGTAGGIFPLAFGIIRDEFPAERVSGALGMMSALIGIGSGAGIVLSGVIADNFSYHWLFWMPMFGIVVAGVAAAVFVPESPVRAPSRIPLSSAALMTVGLGTMLFAISEVSSWGWISAPTLGLVAAGLAVLVYWTFRELRSPSPLVDMRVMARRGVWTTNLTGFLLGIGMYGSFILIPQLAELPTSTGFGLGASITGAGLFMLPSTLGMLIAGTVSGRLERRFSSKPLLLAGAIAASASFVLLAIAHHDGVEIAIASVMQGLGVGLAFAAMANLIVIAVPQEQVGVASGINAISRTVGGALGSQVVASFLAASVLVTTHLPAESGFVVSFWICAVGIGLGAVAAGLVPGRAAAEEQRALAGEPVASKAS